MRLASDATLPAAGPDLLQAVQGRAAIRITGRTARLVTADVQADTPATLRLGQIFFPYWRAMADGGALSVHAGEDGFVDVEVPPGHHNISIFLAHGLLERAGLALSITAFAAWLAAMMLAARGPVTGAARPS